MLCIARDFKAVYYFLLKTPPLSFFLVFSGRARGPRAKSKSVLLVFESRTLTQDK